MWAHTGIISTLGVNAALINIPIPSDSGLIY